MANAIVTVMLALPLALATTAPAALPEATPQPSVAGVAAPRTVMPLVVFGQRRGGMAELRRSPDGLFYLDALVNGVPVRFLVDTGANAVVLTADDALRAGVRPLSSATAEFAQTAGGKVAMSRIRLRTLEAGPMRKDNVEAAVVEAGLPVSLLGQSWLSQLGSVTITGDRMVLQ